MKNALLILVVSLFCGCSTFQQAKQYRNYWTRCSLGFMCPECAFNGIVSKAELVSKGGDGFRSFHCQHNHDFVIYDVSKEESEQKFRFSNGKVYRVIVQYNDENNSFIFSPLLHADHWQTLYCTRKDGDLFECGDKDFDYFTAEADMSKLHGKKIPASWTRVKMKFYPFRPIHGISIPPFFGYTMTNYSGKVEYVDGFETYILPKQGH